MQAIKKLILVMAMLVVSTSAWAHAGNNHSTDAGAQRVYIALNFAAQSSGALLGYQSFSTVQKEAQPILRAASRHSAIAVSRLADHTSCTPGDDCCQCTSSCGTQSCCPFAVQDMSWAAFAGHQHLHYRPAKLICVLREVFVNLDRPPKA